MTANGAPDDAQWAGMLEALACTTPGLAACAAAQAATGERVGFRLFTIMTSEVTGTDPLAGEAARVYSSDPASYPVSGRKPITANAWTRTVLDAKQPFVANSIEAIAEVFPDHPLIASLGCGSVINVPVVVAGSVIGTANILHEAGFYTPERVEAAMALRPLYALAMLAAERFGR